MQVEPVFYHSLPAAIPEEFMHAVDACGVIALTMGEGRWAMNCIRQRVPFFGVTLSDAHTKMVITKLEAEV